MTRGLPYSFLVHALVLILVVVYGNVVTRPPLQSVQTIPFRLVHQQAIPAPEAKPAVQPEEKPPVIEPKSEEKPAVLPPKEVPVKPPVVKKDPAPETKPVHTSQQTMDIAAPETLATPTTFASGPRVEGTDRDFPFAWYLTRIEGLIDRNWNPRQLGFGARARISCAIHFEIVRDGSVGGVSLTTPSGVGVYDRDALRAVQTTRLPPLPPQYSGSRLGVTFIFNLEPDS